MSVGARGWVGEGAGELYLPSDIGIWLARNALASLVLNIVQKVEEHRLLPPTPGAGGSSLPPRVMLGLLTYYYAVGTFGSHHIARSAKEDEAIQPLCARHPPEPESIQTFRRQHGGLVEEC